MQSFLTLPATTPAKAFNLRLLKSNSSIRKWDARSFPSQLLLLRIRHHVTGVAGWICNDAHPRSSWRSKKAETVAGAAAAADSSSDGGIDLLGRIARVGEMLSMAFPLWVALGWILGGRFGASPSLCLMFAKIAGY